MTVEIKVPRLAESISDAVLVEWLKPDGAAVRAGEPVATLETDKAAVEIPADESGVLRHARKVGDHLVADDVLARVEPGAVPAAPPAAAGAAAASLGAADASAAARPAIAPAPAAPAPAAAPTGPPRQRPSVAATPARESAEPLSPAVRRLVEEHGLDPARIEGTGRGGRLLKEDVLRHLERPPAAPAPAAPAPPAPAAAAPAAPPEPAVAPASAAAPAWAGDEDERVVPMGRIRQRIAERLVRAQQTAAILTTFNEVDMSAVLALRARYRETFEKRHGVRLGFMGFFTRACVHALAEVPELNAELRGGDLVYRRHAHMGIAVGTERGLVVPVIHGADTLDLAGIEREIARLAAKARDGALSLDDLTGGTFTISNGGVYGSLLSTPILNPPQSGILGMHTIQKRPVAVEDRVEIRPMMYLALSYDHRIVDGEQAVTFLVRVKQRLEEPERMLLGV
jgi:2-oxoglutarate dehydrogenase E2 component (dihydrolipoamide succinyltransferase)